MEPFACPQFTADFGQLVWNKSEMNEQWDMTHILFAFIPAGNWQWLCKALLGSEGNLEITGGSQGCRQRVSTLYGFIPLQPNWEKQ